MVQNTVKGCTGVALDGSASTGYGHNVFNDNNGGGAQVAGGPIEIDKNICGGDTVCP